MGVGVKERVVHNAYVRVLDWGLRTDGGHSLRKKCGAGTEETAQRLRESITEPAYDPSLVLTDHRAE